MSDRELHQHYEKGGERDRLDDRVGQVEYARTIEVVRRHLPSPPAVVADVGGGPGRYALWLGGEGYEVVHRDVVPLHVSQLDADARSQALTISTAVGDARSLDLDDMSVDAVLLLGPLYHLTSRADRVQALREANRVVKPGGPVFAAAVSRWALRLQGELVARLGDAVPAIQDHVDRVERTGVLDTLFPGSFSGYCHRPGQLRAELRAAGLRVVDVVSLEGLAFALGDLEERMSRPESRALVLDAARAIERVPELLGIGPHLLATARRPQSPRVSPRR
jgi:SAM-dependent methyltransferase